MSTGDPICPECGGYAATHKLGVCSFVRIDTPTGPIPPATADDLQFDLERGYRLWMEKHYESSLGIPGGAIGLIIRRCHAAEERVRELEAGIEGGLVPILNSALVQQRNTLAERVLTERAAGRREGIKAVERVVIEMYEGHWHSDPSLRDALVKIRALLDAEGKEAK